MTLKTLFVLKNTQANVTLERLDVTNAVNGFQVFVQVSSPRKRLAADVTLNHSRPTLRPTARPTVCRVVVSADRCQVVECHRTDWAMNTWWQNLKQNIHCFVSENTRTKFDSAQRRKSKQVNTSLRGGQNIRHVGVISFPMV